MLERCGRRVALGLGVIGAVAASLWPSSVAGQSFSFEFGATRGLHGGSEATYRGPSLIVALQHNTSAAFSVRAGYHGLRIKGEGAEAGAYEVEAHISSVGVVLRAPVGSVSPYVHASAGFARFGHLRGDAEAPGATMAIEGGGGLEIGRREGVTWLLEVRPLLLFTDELIESKPVLLWPIMLGMRVHFRR